MADLEELGARVVDTDISNHKIEEEVVELRKQIDKQNNVLKDKQNRLGEVINSKSQEEEKLNSIEGRIESFENEMNDKRKEVKKKKMLYEEQVRQEFKLRSQLSNEKLRLANYNKEIKKLETETNKLKDEIDQLSNKQEEIKSNMDELDVEFNERKTEHLRYSEEYRKLEELKNELLSMSNDYLKKNTKSTIEIKKIKNEISYYEESNNKLKNDAIEIDNNLKNTKNKKNSLEGEFKELRKRVNTFINRINKTNKESSLSFPLLEEIYKHVNNLQLFIDAVEDYFEGAGDLSKIKAESDNLRSEIANLNDKFFLEKQEFKVVENENNILKEMRKKLDKDFELLQAKKADNTLLLDLNDQDQKNKEPKEHYLELIYEEIKNLTKTIYPKEDFSEKNKEVINEIIQNIAEESKNKVQLLINDVRVSQVDNQLNYQSHNPHKKPSPEIEDQMSQFTLENPDEDSQVDFDLRADTSLNEPNLYNLHESQVLDQRFASNSKANPSIRNILRNSKSAKFYDLSEFRGRGSNASSRKDLRLQNKPSFKHLYRDYNESNENELKERWNELIKYFINLVSYFLKSSSLLANVVSLMSSKAGKHNDNGLKIKSIIVKLVY